MILEEYIDKGFILMQLLRASRIKPIMLDNGRIRIGGVSETIGGVLVGSDNIEYTTDILMDAIKQAYEK